jgi:hypothetical protein
VSQNSSAFSKQKERIVSEPQEAVDPEPELAERYRSHRGKFAIFQAPDVRRPPTPESVASTDMSQAADGFDYSGLLGDNEEQEIRDTIGEMARAIAPGAAVTPLFHQPGPDGMSLVHAWFGPHFPLFRHSHPKHGDCLYYVVAGQAILGSRVLGAGDGFFVPNGMPYKYRAGPEGVEVLEFRAGGGNPDAPSMKLDESSLDSLRRIIDSAKEHQVEWQAPERISDGNLVPQS